MAKELSSAARPRDKASYDSAKLAELMYWREFKLSGNELFLKRAIQVVSNKLELNAYSHELMLLKAFLLIEQGESAEAESLIAEVKRFKPYYKSNDEQFFAKLLFVEFNIDLNKGRGRTSDKKAEILEKYITGRDKPDKFGELLVAYSRLLLGDAGGCFAAINRVFAGKKPALLYLVSYMALVSGAGGRFCGEELFYRTVKWALAHGAELEALLDNNCKLVSSNAKLMNELGESLYRRHGQDWLLSELCAVLIARGDCSLTAYQLYKDAEYKQLELHDLYYYLVKSARENDVENISRYSIEQFIKLGKSDKTLDIFINHLIIANKTNSGLLNLFENRIANFAIANYGDNDTSRYFNSMYKLICESGRRLELPSAAIAEAKSRISKSLFQYEIMVENPVIRSIWVYEKSLKDMRAYPVTGGKATVTAINDDFQYFLMTEGQKGIVADKIKYKKLVQNADIGLYKTLMNGEFRTTELVAALSAYAVSLEKPGEEWLEVLESALGDQKISRSFKMRVSACIGTVYAAAGNFGKAVPFFNSADENCLDQVLIENMLLAYVNAGDYSKAVRLIMKKPNSISEKNLFYSIKRIAQKQEFEKELAQLSFALIVNGWYDKTLMAIVLKHYNGSQGDWHKLSEALDELSVTEPGLDEIILKNSIWTHKFDKGSQGVFARVFEKAEKTKEKNTESGKLISDYALYCAYEILVNRQKPEYVTIDLLERYAIENNDFTVSAALCHYYINNSLQTLHSDKILSDALDCCARDGIVFPVFRQVKDKALVRPYIEKHQAFLFTGRPDKAAYLHYSFDGGENYYSKKMRYFKFGIYLAHLPCFFDERIKYYFSEETSTGSVVTKEEELHNLRSYVNEDARDLFFTVNSALVYEQLFKYDKVEEIITDRLREKPRLRSWIM